MNKVPTPRECGLPAKFDKWRPQQEEGLRILRSATKRVRPLCAPPGYGKTPVYMADAFLSKKPTCIVTHSLALQDQNMENYGSMGLVNLTGRSNHQCSLRAEDPHYTCEQGYAAKCPYKGTVNCPSSFQEIQASSSMLVQTNYAKWIHSRLFGTLQHIERVVFDEGHEMASALGQAMQVILNSHEVEEVLEINFPDTSEAQFFPRWKMWAAEAKVRSQELMLKAKADMVAGARTSVVKRFTHLKNLTRRLSILASANPNNWIVEEIQKGYQFDPIDPARYAESSLLLEVPEIVVVSATLRPKSLFMAGIRQEFFDFTEFPSDFDPTRCPFYYMPVMRVDSRADSLKPLWVKVDQVAARRRDRNGLIQSVSHLRREESMENSRFASSMLFNAKGESATAAVRQMKRNYPGAILTSPSVTQGFSFDYNLAEWQVLCKIPFPPKSKILEARKERDREYPMYLTWQKLGQAAGRIMRDHKDQGETFLFDANFEWFRKFSHLAPKSFWQFFKEISVLPAPPERLPWLL